MAEPTNLYRVTPRKLTELATDALEVGLVPNVIGSPGTGKSALMRAIAKSFNLELIDHRVSTSAPEDFTGLPEFVTVDGIRRAQFTPFTEIFPIEGMEVPKGKDGWLVFLDEFNSGTKMVQAAAYKTILDRMTGQKRLHERVGMACAGNLIGDRAIVTQMGTAMQSRLVHLELMVSHDEWLYDVALKEKYDERVIAFLNYDSPKLMDFRPDHDDKTFCCPRTWEFMNKLVKGKKVSDEKIALYAGTITSGVAAEFVAFCELQAGLVTIREVLADPENANMPVQAQQKWIVVTHLMSKITEADFGNICTYINRYDLSFKVLFYRAAMVQHPELRAHPDFVKAMIALSKYLKG